MKNTIIAVDQSGSYRVYVTVSTQLTEEARIIHNTTPLATAALGRVLAAAGMMGLMLKGEKSTLTLHVKGDGPAIEVLATANSQGQIKGYIADPDVDLPLNANGKLDVGKAVGQGTLTVIKDLKMKEPYIGRVDLVSGEIAEDLTQYFLVSEQQPSSVALGVKIGTDGKVSSAGGMILQVLPDASEECLDYLEKMMANLQSITSLIEQAQDPSELLKIIFLGAPAAYAPSVLEERSIEWKCDCSTERMKKALVAIGEKDLKEITVEDKSAELTCQFCLKKYTFDEEELNALLKEARYV
ncbi:MAG: Hsp33 family molecular chaperone HslO [Clostridia bacterium]|nr:Hsp33 family molecular chaperone HslO [Clostridia bacterium]